MLSLRILAKAEVLVINEALHVDRLVEPHNMVMVRKDQAKILENILGHVGYQNLLALALAYLLVPANVRRDHRFGCRLEGVVDLLQVHHKPVSGQVVVHRPELGEASINLR